MASPVVLSTSTSGTSTVATPAGTTAGDLLIIAVVVDGIANTPSLAGFTELYNLPTETYAIGAAWYKIADGTEGASITITVGGPTTYVACAAYRIGSYSGVPEAVFTDTGNSTTQTSPPITILQRQNTL